MQGLIPLVAMASCRAMSSFDQITHDFHVSEPLVEMTSCQAMGSGKAELG